MEKVETLTIIVFKFHKHYFARCTRDPIEEGYNPPGMLFLKKISNATPQQIEDFYDQVRKECRSRGIARVQNLDN